MSKINSTISRRDLIKSLAGIGLLSSVGAEQLLAQSSSAPYRVLLVALQHGWGISGNSNQKMSGEEYEFSFPTGLSPLNAIKQHCVVVDSLLTLGQWGNNHDLSYADIFTGGVLHGASSSAYDSQMPLSTKPSLDFLLQEASGKPTLRLSAAYRSWGVQYHPISFDRSSNVLPFYTTALDAYNSVFKNLPDSGGGTPIDSGEARLVDSIFSTIKNPALRQEAALGGNEREKIRRYLEAITSVEDKRKPIVAFSGGHKLANVPVRGQDRFKDLEHYLDMIKVAFANNMTTSAVLGIGDIHPISQFHHDHAHNNTQVWWDTRQEFAATIANFANSLAAITDTDGRTLLDNTLIVLTGEVGDGTHDVLSKGHILVGGGSRIQTGRILKTPRISGSANLNGLMRENISGGTSKQLAWVNTNTAVLGNRTNADLMRDIGNIAGLNLQEFGLPTQNKGYVLL
ncbi:MAG: DUF1552 domain-containing protein [Cellvibrionaceae bacterium]|nr:DUF1552 domain-containing protein [Cellvibrionaceae bacterium]